ncbi:MAG: hypothetical protein OJJ21_01150 [Ferrovibrio sp.]|uniref:hypothetical protein n=1 Tax=Ferrovibrio sp. TaxID=1917215 RepID=UPI00263679C3|nr:hypothetical protein [Ferrovibrio sp.]MCW0232182.1 hypothetical protein [Ferrovibrio sp.]
MLRRLLPGLLIAAIALPAVAQEGLGPGRRAKRPDICMNTIEIEAEAMVRGGMVIRDHARACARRGLDGSIIHLWAAFDTANAEKFQDATEIRAGAYKRNWPDDPNAAQRAANETVASRQLVDFSPVECVVLKDLVGGFKTWTDYLVHIRRTEVGQVKTLYKQCPKGTVGAQRRKQEW